MSKSITIEQLNNIADIEWRELCELKEYKARLEEDGEKLEYIEKVDNAIEYTRTRWAVFRDLVDMVDNDKINLNNYK